jgi:hypothetical protein
MDGALRFAVSVFVLDGQGFGWQAGAFGLLPSVGPWVDFAVLEDAAEANCGLCVTILFLPELGCQIFMECVF